MNRDSISIKDKALTIKNYAALSAQHCELLLIIFRITQMNVGPETKEATGYMQQTYREIRNNADLLYKKRPSDETKSSQTDMILLRNILANFNRTSIEFIDDLTELAKDDSLEAIHPFFKHILAEQKLFLEEAYPLNF